MSHETMPSGQEQQPGQPPMDSNSTEKEESHYMSLKDVIVHLKEDERYESLKNNEQAMDEKAGELQLILDQLVLDPEFASKLHNPDYMYFVASVTSKRRDTKEEERFDPDINR